MKAQIKLRFHAQSGQLAVAIRSFQLTAKRAKAAAGSKAAIGAGGTGGGARGRGRGGGAAGGDASSSSSSSSSVPMMLQFKALDQVVSTIDPATRVKRAMTYRCADMDKVVPQLMG